MTEYKVVWKIDIDADNTRDAALQAQKLINDPCDWVYEVTDPDGKMIVEDLEVYQEGDDEDGNKFEDNEWTD